MMQTVVIERIDEGFQDVTLAGHLPEISGGAIFLPVPDKS